MMGCNARFAKARCAHRLRNVLENLGDIGERAAARVLRPGSREPPYGIFGFGKRSVELIAEEKSLSILRFDGNKHGILRKTFRSGLCSEACLASVAGKCAQRDQERLDVDATISLHAAKKSLKNLLAANLGPNQWVSIAALRNLAQERIFGWVPGTLSTR